MSNNLTIKTRLFLLIGLMSVVAISLSILGLRGMKKANDGLQTVYSDRVVPLKDLKVIADMYAVNIVDTTHKVRNGNISWQEAIQNVENAEKVIQEKWEGYLSTVLVAEENKLVAEITPLFESTKTKLDKLKNILKQNDSVAVSDFSINELYPAIDPISGKFSELIDVQLFVAKREYETAQARYQMSLIISIIFLVLGLSISIFIGVLMTRRLLSELGGEPSYAASIVKEVANGNLSVNVSLKSGDKTSLLYSINEMRETLNDTIVNVNVTMDEISQGILHSRIAGEFKGDFAKIQSGMNKSLDAISDTLNEVMHVTEAIANGDLSQKITGEYQGAFAKTKDSVNHTVDELKKLVDEIESIVYSGADCGNFNVKMSLQGKVGYNKRLAELINKLFETTDKSLNDVLKIAESLAKGDLTKTIDADYVGAFAAVKVGINNTVDNLKNLISEVQRTSEVIATAAREISAGNNDLSSRTQEQASSLEETAASMEELSSTIQQNTASAKEASDMVLGASTTAKEGVKAVDHVVSTMNTINESSRKIVDIITAIDDIAFQTNILALNAAVEASRAGEQGKGFAVVAVEVRNLAQRAANAAGEIKMLIDASVQSISEGSKQVAQAGNTMKNIVNAIENATAMMGNIVSASSEQSAGIDQVHQAITQMDSVTQQNATLVEQAAAATASLSEQTRSLSQEMEQFKVTL